MTSTPCSPCFEQLQSALKDAMRARDRARLDALRLVVAEVKNEALNTASPADDTLVMAVLKRSMKKHRQAEEAFREGGRDELADKEAASQVILAEFCPPPLSDQALAALVDEALQACDAKGPSDMGAVMRHAQEAAQGRADMRALSAQVKQRLLNN